MDSGENQIISVYGEPDGRHTDGTAISYDFEERDNGVFGVFGSIDRCYYQIFFDENGKAYRVEKGLQPGG